MEAHKITDHRTILISFERKCAWLLENTKRRDTVIDGPKIWKDASLIIWLWPIEMMDSVFSTTSNFVFPVTNMKNDDNHDSTVTTVRHRWHRTPHLDCSWEAAPVQYLVMQQQLWMDAINWPAFKNAVGCLLVAFWIYCPPRVWDTQASK